MYRTRNNNYAFLRKSFSPLNDFRSTASVGFALSIQVIRKVDRAFKILAGLSPPGSWPPNVSENYIAREGINTLMYVVDILSIESNIAQALHLHLYTKPTSQL